MTDISNNFEKTVETHVRAPGDDMETVTEHFQIRHVVYGGGVEVGDILEPRVALANDLEALEPPITEPDYRSRIKVSADKEPTVGARGYEVTVSFTRYDGPSTNARALGYLAAGERHYQGAS